MTAKPATVRSVMRIYVHPQGWARRVGRYKEFGYDFSGRKSVSIYEGEELHYTDKDGMPQFEFRPIGSAPVEFVRWPEKTK